VLHYEDNRLQNVFNTVEPLSFFREKKRAIDDIIIIAPMLTCALVKWLNLGQFSQALH